MSRIASEGFGPLADAASSGPTRGPTSGPKKASTSPDMGEPAIRARGLSRRFGDLLAVDGLDIDVAPRSIFGFLGPNGCGKTTTVRLLTGLLTPSAGEMTVLGHRLPAEAEVLKRRIGYGTQKFSLYEDLTVRENLRFVASIYGLPPRESRARIAELLATYALERLQHQRAGSMSGGQRQRLSLAAAILHRPALLFLDEPTSAVDPENRRDFWERLFDLIDAGATILVSTHYMDEAERCHRLAILEAGRKRADGSPAELMAAMGARVLEVEGPGLRQLKSELIALPEILSAAQLGSRLRVLVSDEVAEPAAWLRALPQASGLTHIDPVRPSLEDVFVTCTGTGAGSDRGGPDTGSGSGRTADPAAEPIETLNHS